MNYIKLNYIKLISIVFFCLLLINVSAAMISVSTEVMEKKEFYSFEEIEVKIIIFNNELIEVNDFQVKVYSDGLKVIEDGKEKEFKEFPPMNLMPESKTEKTIIFKAKENADKEYFVFTEYGISDKEFQNKAKINIKKNEILFEALIKEINSNEFEKNSILIEFENNSSESIKNVKIELKENNLIEIKTPLIEFNEFISGQKISNTPIEFITLKKIETPMNLFVELSFTDETGIHLIKKEIEFNPNNNELLFTALIAVILIGLLILIYFQAKTKKEKIIQEKQKTLEETKKDLMN
jgi:hypothetical protein